MPSGKIPWESCSYDLVRIASCSQHRKNALYYEIEITYSLRLCAKKVGYITVFKQPNNQILKVQSSKDFLQECNTQMKVEY